MRRLRTSMLCLVLAGCTLAGCGILDPDDWVQRRETLERNRDRWQAETAYRYTYTFSMSCECLPGFAGPVVIEVTGDEVTSLTPQRDDIEIPEEQWQAFITVAEAFQLIESAIDDRAHHFDVQYHPLLGYPTRIELDGDRSAVDDEMLMHISDLEILTHWAVLE